VNRQRCKEIPRGSISPASEHKNRRQPYSQSWVEGEGGGNWGKSTEGKGKRAKTE